MFQAVSAQESTKVRLAIPILPSSSSYSAWKLTRKPTWKLSYSTYTFSAQYESQMVKGKLTTS